MLVLLLPRIAAPLNENSFDLQTKNYQSVFPIRYGVWPTLPAMPLLTINLISTRRFFARPAAVVFSATGSSCPYPKG
jgi:hypothetical protein